MRDRSLMGKNTLFMEILKNIGYELSKKKMWDQYLTICETVGAECELAEKCANLLVTEPNIKPILEELDKLYDRFKSVTKSSV